MSSTTRERLVRLVRRPDADLVEAALLVCAEPEPEPDIEGAPLRVDALADGLRTRGLARGDPGHEADALARYLGGSLGFHGTTEQPWTPDDALLTRVLERRRGLPISLTILFVGIARRLAMTAFPIALPGHVVAGIGGGDHRVVCDPFHGGRQLDEAALVERVRAATSGELEFRRSMLRPAPASQMIRRLLNNLTRDFLADQRVTDALWTIDLKLLLPNRVPGDHRARGELLDRCGRFDLAAHAFEEHLELIGPDAPDASATRRAAIRVRARMN